MHPISDKGRLDAACKCVDDHPDRKEEASSIRVDSCHIGKDGGAADQEVDTGNNLIDEGVAREDDMWCCTISNFCDLQESLGVGRSTFEFDCGDGEEQDLNTCTSSILRRSKQSFSMGRCRFVTDPKGTRYSISIAIGGRREQGCCDCPGTNDGRCSQSSLHRVLCSHEHLRVLDLVHVSTKPPRQERHANGEGGTHANDNPISNTLAERR